LGVDCLWLSPIFASPKKDMGYDVSNCIAVDPQRGQYYLRNFLASQPDFEFSQSSCD
jgi:glycosidase